MIHIKRLQDTRPGDEGGEYEYACWAPRIQVQFKHRRSEGLAACLRAAADAIERHHEENLMKIIWEIKDDST